MSNVECGTLLDARRPLSFQLSGRSKNAAVRCSRTLLHKVQNIASIVRISSPAVSSDFA